jgi:endoglucanase
MTVAKLLVGALAATSLVSATLPKLGGVNLAGLDFGIDINGGSGNFVAPPLAQVDHFAAAGANAVRIPFGWQYATPQLGGALNANFFATLDALVQRALSKGQWAILDLHNYARFNGGIVGQGGPTNAQVR